MRPDTSLFNSELQVISAGVSEFAEALRQQSVSVVELDWQPPASGDAGLVEILKQVYGDQTLVERIDAANQETLERILNSNPQVVDVAPAAAAMGLPVRLGAPPDVGLGRAPALRVR